jgi:hypothetical protein
MGGGPFGAWVCRTFEEVQPLRWALTAICPSANVEKCLVSSIDGGDFQHSQRFVSFGLGEAVRTLPPSFIQFRVRFRGWIGSDGRLKRRRSVLTERNALATTYEIRSLRSGSFIGIDQNSGNVHGKYSRVFVFGRSAKKGWWL